MSSSARATAIRGHVSLKWSIREVEHPRPIMSRKVLLNGYLDELLCEQRSVDVTLRLGGLRSRGRVNEQALAADDDPAFSVRNREGVPAPPRGTATTRPDPE
jgi:hypothetical protein